MLAPTSVRVFLMLYQFCGFDLCPRISPRSTGRQSPHGGQTYSRRNSPRFLPWLKCCVSSAQLSGSREIRSIPWKMTAGAVVAHAFLPTAWWSLGLTVGAAMAAMAALRIIHPPAGGTPIATLLAHEGWGYLLTPVVAGSLILTTCALIHRALCVIDYL